MFNNPIFTREFTSTSRSWKSNFLVTIYLVLLAFVLLILWPSGGILSVVSESSKQLFALFFSVNLTLIILLVPAFSATSITQEHENNTFAALFTTLMTPVDIMLGKLMASILMLIILVFLSMPISSVCALTGGVDLIFMGQVILLILMTALSYGMMGLACSSKCTRSSSSILMNYVLILFFAGATWLPSALLGGLIGLEDVWQIVRSISPYDALFYLLYPNEYKMTMNIQSSGTLITPYTIFLFSSFSISFVSLIIFYKNILNPANTKASAKGEVYTDTKKAIKRKLSWPFYLFDPLKRKKPIARFINPVFVAEMRSKLFANPRFVARTVFTIFVISLSLLTLIALQFGATLRADTVRMVAIIFQIGVIGMLAPGVSSGLITDEITSGTFVQLRLTPLKPWTVILGKLQATFFYALIFIVSSFFVLFAMAYLEQQRVWPDTSIFSGEFWTTVMNSSKSQEWWHKVWMTYRTIVIWIFILLISTITFLTAGLFSSTVSRTTGIATAVSYSLTAIITIVTLAPVVMKEKLSEGLATFILSFNPIASAMQATSDSFADYPSFWFSNILAMSSLTAFFLFASVVRTWFLFNKQE